MCHNKFPNIYWRFWNLSTITIKHFGKHIRLALGIDYIFFCKISTTSMTFLFLSGFPFTDIDNSQDSRGREGTMLYSSLPLPPARGHSDIYLQLCMWDDYHVFLIASLVTTCCLIRFTILLNYHLIDWWCNINFCLVAGWFDSRLLLQ